MASLELPSAAAVARFVSANLHDQSIAGQTDFLRDARSHRQRFVCRHSLRTCCPEDDRFPDTTQQYEWLVSPEILSDNSKSSDIL